MKAALVLIIAMLATVVMITSTNSAYSSSNSIMINEVELNPAGTDSGFEMVELYNPTNAAIDINGWTLSSTAGRTVTVTLDGTIAPAEYLVVNRGSQWLDNEGEAVVLRTATGSLIDNAGPFSDDDNDARTWQRSPDGSDNWVFASATIGQSNVGTDSSTVAQPETEEPDTITPPSPSEPVSTTGGSGELKIVFIDVGQGDSTLVIMPNGKTMLIDGGERDQSNTVLSTLQEHNVTEIDIMVATHPHADHIGGLIGVMNQINVSRFLDSGQVHTTQTFEDLLDAIEVNQIPLVTVRQGDNLSLDPNVTLTVLNPPASLPDGADDEEEFNNNSVVIKLTYGEFTALFPGDIEAETEMRLSSTNRTDLDSDVVLASHHGSKGSNTSPYLEAVSPEVVIIYAGENNRYGHPHSEALERINASGVQHIFRTDLDGIIVLTSNGTTDYSIETVESKKVVVVPEFDIAIMAAAAILLMSVVIAGRGRALWRPFGGV